MVVLVTNMFIIKVIMQFSEKKEISKNKTIFRTNYREQVRLVMFEPKGCNVSILVRFRREGCSGLSRQAGRFLFEPFGCTMLHLKSLKGLYIEKI